MNLAGAVHGIAGDFINLAFLFVAQHRTFADAGARNQAGHSGERRKVLRQSGEAFQIESARAFERRDVRNEETAETLMKGCHKILRA